MTTSPPSGRLSGAAITALGIYVPERIVTNDEISQTLDTSDEWIRTRTGIRERRIARPDQAASDLGTIAAQRCLASAGLDPAAVDLIIVTTISPDHMMPATASLVAHNIGAVNAGAFDIQAGCTGFVYGLAAGASFVAAGMYTNVLVLGAEVVSRMVNWQDRSTCVLFGDGAGAVLVQPAGPDSTVCFDLGNDGSGAEFLNIPAGGSRLPADEATVRERLHTMHMAGGEVFKFATRIIAESCEQVLHQAEMTVDDVDLFVPHQANLRIIDSAVRRLGFDPERVFHNVERYGNTSCASIPICLSEASAGGRLKRGDTLMLAGFGAGLTWGTCILTWQLDGLHA